VSVAAPGSVVQPAPGGTVGWVALQGGKDLVGRAGPLDADAPPWAGALFGWEVRLEVMDPQFAPYRALPGTPPVERDLALVLPPGVTAAAVEAVVRRTAGPLLESLVLFDEYRGAGVPSGHRSVAWRCTFRDPSRTLREAEADAALGKALEVLEGELGVRRRAS
jgi:phenylalanyl-tRNA synthetase beta chain